MPDLRKKLVKNINDIDVVHMHLFRSYQNIILYKFCKNNIPYIMDVMVLYHMPPVSQLLKGIRQVWEENAKRS